MYHKIILSILLSIGICFSSCSRYVRNNKMLINTTDNQQDALVQETLTNKHDQKKEEEKICPICFEVVQNDLNCIELSACKEYKHQYHKECIKQYYFFENYEFRYAPLPRCLFCQANIDPLDLERVGYVTKRCDFCFRFSPKDLFYVYSSCGHSVHTTCRREHYKHWIVKLSGRECGCPICSVPLWFHISLEIVKLCRNVGIAILSHTLFLGLQSICSK